MKNGCAFFGGPVSDAAGGSLCAEAVSNSTKSSTVWGICVWNEWGLN